MLKAIVTDIAIVDESLRSLYEQDGTRYKLKVEPVEGFELDNVKGLKTALAAERSIVSGYKDKLTAFEGIDPTSARAAVERLAAFGDIDPAKAKEGLSALDRFSKFDPAVEAERIAEEKVKNSKTQLKAEFTAEKVALDAKIKDLTNALSARDAQITKTLKSGTISTELAKLNPLDEAREALEIMAANVVQIKEVNGEFQPVVVDAAGNPRVKLADDYSSIPFSVADLMAEMRDKRAALFKPDASKTGVDMPRNQAPAGGNGQPNPFAKGSINLTQQMTLLKSDPTRAAQLRREAGAA